MKKLYLKTAIFSGIFLFTISTAQIAPDRFCAQVITPAKNPQTGECREFPTPCHVPSGWIKVKSCASDSIEIKDKPLDCKEYYWYDNKTRDCQGPKVFCGAFMYEGLRVFETKTECQEDLKKQDFYLLPQPSVLPTIPLLEKEKSVPFSIEVNVCALSDKYLSEINDLVKQADSMRSQGDLEGEKNILEKIKILKEKIEEAKKACAKMIETRSQLEKNNEEIRQEVCRMQEKIEKKIEYYKGLLSLSLDEIEKKGYKKDEIEKILRELIAEKEKIRLICSGEKTREELDVIKPVAPEDLKEVVSYYKEKVASIIEKPSFSENQVQEMKKLNQETQAMVKELVRSKDQISLKEAQGFIERIEFQAGQIKINEEEVKISQEKTIEATIKNRPLNILIDKEKINLKQENLVVQVETEFVLEKDKMLFQNQEIKIDPKEALLKLNLKKPEVLSMKLELKDNQPVYEIKATEEKKLFFIFPVKVKKEIVIDATKEEALKIKEGKPWWSIFAF